MEVNVLHRHFIGIINVVVEEIAVGINVTMIHPQMIVYKKLLMLNGFLGQEWDFMVLSFEVNDSKIFVFESTFTEKIASRLKPKIPNDVPFLVVQHQW